MNRIQQYNFVEDHFFFFLLFCGIDLSVFSTIVVVNYGTYAKSELCEICLDHIKVGPGVKKFVWTLCPMQDRDLTLKLSNMRKKIYCIASSFI